MALHQIRHPLRRGRAIHADMRFRCPRGFLRSAKGGEGRDEVPLMSHLPRAPPPKE